MSSNSQTVEEHRVFSRRRCQRSRSPMQTAVLNCSWYKMNSFQEKIRAALVIYLAKLKVIAFQ